MEMLENRKTLKPMLPIYFLNSKRSSRKNNIVQVKIVHDNGTEQNLGDTKADTEANAKVLHWWILYFKLSYYLCSTPYQIQTRPCLKSRVESFHEAEECPIVLHRNKFQKILYYIFQTASILIGLMSFAVDTSEQSIGVQYSVQYYFGYAIEASSLVYMMTFVYVFWTCEDNFVNILKSIFERNCNQRKTEKSTERHNNLCVKVVGHTVSSHLNINRVKAIILIIGAFVFVGCSALYDQIIDYYYSGKDLHQIVRTNREILNSYLKSISVSVSFDTEDEITYLEIFVHIFLFFGLSYSSFLNQVFGLFSVLTILFYGQLVNEFSERYLKPLNVSVEEVVSELRWFQGLVRKINNAVSKLLLVEIVGTLPFYVQTLPIVITTSTFGSSEWRYCFYCLYYFWMILYGAHQFHKLDDGLKCWILRPQTFEKFSEKELNSLYFELNCHNDSTALRVMGSYVINYSLLASVVSVVITYTIISLQLGSPGAATESRPQHYSNLTT